MDIRSDADGLMNRERINRTKEKYDFTKWIANQIDPKPGMKVLDVGCGTGKQVISVARNILPGGEIFGVDISKEAISILNNEIIQHGYKHISTFCIDMDESPQIFKDYQFDLIYSVYAFYYSNNMIELLRRLEDNLKESGDILLFGPGEKSNRELIDIINNIDGNHSNYYNDFLTKSELKEIEHIYDISAGERFENVITFNEATDLMLWLESSELNDTRIQDDILSMVRNRIYDHGNFKLTKETVSFSLKMKG